MIEPLRHRKTKEAAGEMFNLQPPRHIPTHENATEANPDGSAAISAKFKCGTALLDAEVVQGVYATSINIHNTQLSSEVQFTKTTVQAFHGGARSSADAAAPRPAPLPILQLLCGHRERRQFADIARIVLDDDGGFEIM